MQYLPHKLQWWDTILQRQRATKRKRPNVCRTSFSGEVPSSSAGSQLRCARAYSAGRTSASHCVHLSGAHGQLRHASAVVQVPPALVMKHTAPAPAARYATPAPAVFAEAGPMVKYVSPAPVKATLHQTQTVQAATTSILEYFAPELVVSYAAPAPTVLAAPAPVVEYTSPAPTESYAAPVPAQDAAPVQCAVPTMTVTKITWRRWHPGCTPAT